MDDESLIDKKIEVFDIPIRFFLKDLKEVNKFHGVILYYLEGKLSMKLEIDLSVV